MDATLHALGGLLLQAIPTILLVILLHFYLKGVFFGPLKKVLAKREAATKGAREAAEASAKRAAEKTSEYERALQEARAQMYKEQEEARRQWLEEQTRLIDEARAHSHQALHTSKQSIEADAAAAKGDLEGQSATLAEQISQLVLEGRTA
jgi:F-type H+-transporting ATPase subunit b